MFKAILEIIDKRKKLEYSELIREFLTFSYRLKEKFYAQLFISTLRITIMGNIDMYHIYLKILLNEKCFPRFYQFWKYVHLQHFLFRIIPLCYHINFVQIIIYFI